MGKGAASRRKKFMEELRSQGEFHDPRTAGALADLLYDDFTDLPTVPLLLGRIRRMLREWSVFWLNPGTL